MAVSARTLGRPKISRLVREAFWTKRGNGMVVKDAAAAVGISATLGFRWVNLCGGVRPRRRPQPSGRYLSLAERVTIEALRTAKMTITDIARQLTRSVSTISRELKRHSDYRGRYDAVRAQRMAEESAKRPKSTKLEPGSVLFEVVQGKLKKNHSPEQISATLPVEFPDLPEMRVAAETIYQSLYVQARGGLRRELTVHLRTGRAIRRTRARPEEKRGKIAGMVNISERPAEVEDRAVPGHWEGDLIVGKDSRSAIGTLVERTTRFVMLLHLPNGHTAIEVREAMTKAIAGLPETLMKSITWDQGSELSQHAKFTVDTGVQIYFCDPHSPWQRGSNENTNGLLRQYFPKGTDLSVHSPQRLEYVANELNTRPRKTLLWNNPQNELNHLLVASTS